MKTLFFLFTGTVFFLFSCTKNNLQTPAGSSDLFNAPSFSSLAKSRTDLLTAHPWMYNGYYFHYIDSVHKGDPEYMRGASDNIINLDNSGFNFKKNGTFVEISDGYVYPGTWHFTDGADTVFVMTYSYGTYTNTIVTLTNSNLNYTHFSGYHNNVYTELIPATH